MEQRRQRAVASLAHTRARLRRGATRLAISSASTGQAVSSSLSWTECGAGCRAVRRDSKWRASKSCAKWMWGRSGGSRACCPCRNGPRPSLHLGGSAQGLGHRPRHSLGRTLLQATTLATISHPCPCSALRARGGSQILCITARHHQPCPDSFESSPDTSSFLSALLRHPLTPPTRLVSQLGSRRARRPCLRCTIMGSLEPARVSTSARGPMAGGGAARRRDCGDNL